MNIRIWPRRLFIFHQSSTVASGSGSSVWAKQTSGCSRTFDSILPLYFRLLWNEYLVQVFKIFSNHIQSDFVTKTFLSDSASSLTERLFALRLTFRVGNSKSFWRSFRKRFRVDVLPHEIRFCFLICFETLVREGELYVRQCSLERVSEVCLCFKLFDCDLSKV